MKILFYNHTGKISGAERVLLTILKGLGSEFDAVVACPADGSLPEVVQGMGLRTLPMEVLSARFTWRPDQLIRYLISFFQVIRAARRVVVAERPELIHANSIRAGLVMSAATFRLQPTVVWHVHDLVPRHPIATAIRLFVCASRRIRVVAVSEIVAQRFRGRLLNLFSSRVPVVTIHNGIDLNKFYPDGESREETRRSLGFDSDQLLVGVVGQLTARKGQLEVIQAFELIANDIPNSVLLVVGEALFNRDDEYKAELKRAAAAAGISNRVRFLGSREDVPALMRAFDLLILNSHSEAFGLTVVEGMASGTAVLASGVDGIREIIRHGQSGWLVPSIDHDTLADALRYLLRETQLRRRLGSQGRLDVVSRFSSDRFVAQIYSFYRSLHSSQSKLQKSSPETFAVEVLTD